MVRLKMIKRRSSAVSNLNLTVETTLLPNLAKSVVDAGGLTTTSTICSPPLIVPQEGLSREMKFEAQFLVSSWTDIGLVVLASTLEAPRR